MVTKVTNPITHSFIRFYGSYLHKKHQSQVTSWIEKKSSQMKNSLLFYYIIDVRQMFEGLCGRGHTSE